MPEHIEQPLFVMKPARSTLDAFIRKINKFVYLPMLFQLENTQQDDVNKLLDFAKQNNLNLSFIDNNDEHYLPGKPLNDAEIAALIEGSRNSGTILMQDAHQIIRKNYDAD
ncbi:MAG: hypothetical protein ACR2KZ_03410 [Segetibacter sp.]